MEYVSHKLQTNAKPMRIALDSICFWNPSLFEATIFIVGSIAFLLSFSNCTDLFDMILGFRRKFARDNSKRMGKCALFSSYSGSPGPNKTFFGLIAMFSYS